ncbi:MAG TPA: magnesium transporter [Vicinamibacterales bacterium]
MTTIRSEARLQEALDAIARLLDKHRVLDTLAARQEGPRRDLLEHLQHRQNLAELHKFVRATHAADLAVVLEALPPDDRRTVWEQASVEQAGHAFVEVSNVVREWLVESTPRETLVHVLTTLDPEDLGYVAESIPPDILRDVSRALASADRQAYEESIQYAEDRVGHHMSRDIVMIAETTTIQQTIEELRALAELPPQTDRVFVIDGRHVLRGSIPLQTLLLKDPSLPVAGACAGDTVTFAPGDDIADAVKAFERYDLVSAPVVDDRGKLVGRLTVDSVMDFVRADAEWRALKQAGLSRDEDLFARPWDSARNRWPWLAINLVTAFIASRVIGRFEGTITSLSALATLMPIVASIGGNTGNQTMAIVIRALAVDQLTPSGAARVLNKELVISLLNGSVWGLVVGVAALGLYSNLALGAVMTSAVVLNLVVAALAGVAIPVALHATGRDPAYGSSVLLTFVTDAMGFFLFLGLASVILF